MPGCRLFFFFFAAVIGAGDAVLAETNCDPWHPDQTAQGDLRVGEILINPQNIFNPEDPEENEWYHQLGNRLHIKTTTDTIAQQLIFGTGDVLELRKLEESERILRSNEYIKSASVRPTEICGNLVTVRVTTVDHWTFTPSVSFERKGGKNTSTTDIEEANLFGLGKKVVVLYDDGLERTSRSIRYYDRNLLGSRHTLNLSSTDNSDGGGQSVHLALPFYQLDSRHAWSLNTSQLKSEQALYEAGDETNRFAVDARNHDISFAWSPGLMNNRVERYRIGWSYSDRAFHNVPETQANQIPQDRHLSYPWISYKRTHERFIKIPNLTVMDATQDVAVGDEFSVMAGFSNPDLGADDRYGIVAASYATNYQPDKHQLNQLSLKVSSILGSGHQRNTTLTAAVDWYHFLSRRYTFLVSGRLAHQDSPPLDAQWELGADNGLRGFPIRYQTGASRVVFNAEQRHMYRVYPWRLFQVASAVFIDIGSAWDRGDSPKWLSDVGVGMRIFPTRSSGKTVIHIDLAFPLDAPDDVDTVQFNVSTKTGF